MGKLKETGILSWLRDGAKLRPGRIDALMNGLGSLYALPWPRRLLLGAATVFAGIIARLLFSHLLGDWLPYVTFTPAVQLAALLGGAASGLFALLLSALAAHLWVAPLATAADFLDLATFVSSGVIISAACEILHRIWIRSQAAEARQSERWAGASAATPCVLYSFRMGADGAGTYSYVSPNAQALFGIEAKDMKADARAMQGRIQADDFALQIDSMAQSARKLTPWAQTYRYDHPQKGAIWIEAGAQPSRQGGGAIVWHGFAHDVTARKQAEMELLHSNASLEARAREAVQAREVALARLEQAEKLGAVGQLAGGVAHDFNNIIQAVLGAAAMIGRHAGDEERVKRFSRMIEEASGRGASVTRRLLVIARHGEIRVETVDVAVLLDDLREVLAHTMGRSVDVRLDLEPELPAILADRSQLETVLINLAINARDAMAGNGLITISASAETVFDGEHPQALSPGAYIRIGVTDTGAEIATERPILTTEESGEGTGLGLPIAASFAEQSGGAFSVDGEAGRGTTATIWLPAASAIAERPEKSESRSLPAAKGRQRVLLIDDEELIREVLAEELTDHGYEVTQAKSGAEALELLDAGEAVDMIVTDLAMPGMDGVTLIRSAQERWPALPAILITGCAGDGAAFAAGGAVSGSFALLRKPVSGPELTDRIGTMLARRRRRNRRRKPGPQPLG